MKAVLPFIMKEIQNNGEIKKQIEDKFGNIVVENVYDTKTALYITHACNKYHELSLLIAGSLQKKVKEKEIDEVMMKFLINSLDQEKYERSFIGHAEGPYSFLNDSIIADNRGEDLEIATVIVAEYKDFILKSCNLYYELVDTIENLVRGINVDGSFLLKIGIKKDDIPELVELMEGIYQSEADNIIEELQHDCSLCKDKVCVNRPNEVCRAKRGYERFIDDIRERSKLTLSFISESYEGVKISFFEPTYMKRLLITAEGDIYLAEGKEYTIKEQSAHSMSYSELILPASEFMDRVNIGTPIASLNRNNANQRNMDIVEERYTLGDKSNYSPITIQWTAADRKTAYCDIRVGNQEYQFTMDKIKKDKSVILIDNRRAVAVTYVRLNQKSTVHKLNSTFKVYDYSFISQ